MSSLKLLIVDDSVLVRNILTNEFSSDDEIDVVGSANDLISAKEKILELKPDIMTLNIEMADMDSIELLRIIMPLFPIPVIVASSLTKRGADLTLEALDNGAIDFILMPEEFSVTSSERLIFEFKSKLKMASQVDVSNWTDKRTLFYGSNTIIKKRVKSSIKKVIAIGASTGGTDAIYNLLCQLPLHTPGIVIVQHFPPLFATRFAARLNQQTHFSVKEAESGDIISNGNVYIAPGGTQMTVNKSGEDYILSCLVGDKVNGYLPSVGALFNSMALNVGKNGFGIILTGMGEDGALEIKEMKDAGAFTIGQDEKSSIVYSMPKVSKNIGGLCKVVSIEQMGSVINDRLEAM